MVDILNMHQERSCERTVKIYAAEIPRFANARKGKISILDAVVRVLWVSSSNECPEHTFNEIAALASKIVGRELGAPAIRGIIYLHANIFERVGDGPRPKWRLSRAMRERGTATR